MLKEHLEPIESIILPPSATVRQAMGVMTGPNSTGIVLVAEAGNKLLGVVVDFDLRKAFLNGRGLETPLAAVMNSNPVTLPFGSSREAILSLFQSEPRANIPLLDDQGKVRGLARLTDYFNTKKEIPNWVVLLVGGQGKRLRPLTKEVPKPMLSVGKKPILGTIIEQFSAFGFKNFILAVNHRADRIFQYFRDGSRMGVRLHYLRETKRLGTAGPLSLMPADIKEPVLVMNGDLLTKVDFRTLLDYHEREKNSATLCVREYDFRVPYGVVQMANHKLAKIVEKPTYRFFVNAGIYVFQPDTFKLLKRNQSLDMPSFVERIATQRCGSVGCFPIQEYWIDVGRLEDYQRAQLEYDQFFTNGNAL